MSVYKYLALFLFSCCLIFILTLIIHVSAKVMAAVIAFRNHLTNLQIPAAVVTQIIDVHGNLPPLNFHNQKDPFSAKRYVITKNCTQSELCHQNPTLHVLRSLGIQGRQATYNWPSRTGDQFQSKHPDHRKTFREDRRSWSIRYT